MVRNIEHFPFQRAAAMSRTQTGKAWVSCTHLLWGKKISNSLTALQWTTWCIVVCVEWSSQNAMGYKHLECVHRDRIWEHIQRWSGSPFFFSPSLLKTAQEYHGALNRVGTVCIKSTSMSDYYSSMGEFAVIIVKCTQQEVKLAVHLDSADDWQWNLDIIKKWLK